MGIAVTFSYTSWAAAFPEFSNVTEAQVVNVALPFAQLYCRNDGGGPVSNATIQTNLLNLVVAHVCQLLYGSVIQPVSPLVGRVNTATEGSVSVGADFPTTPNSAWFMQTKYGAMYWQACAAYRTMRYLPGPRRNFNPWLVW